MPAGPTQILTFILNPTKTAPRLESQRKTLKLAKNPCPSCKAKPMVNEALRKCSRAAVDTEARQWPNTNVNLLHNSLLYASNLRCFSSRFSMVYNQGTNTNQINQIKIVKQIQYYS